MDSLAFIMNLSSLISAACRDPEKLPGALISCGVVQAAAALCLIIFRTPGGIFLHHGKAPTFLYYGFLIAIVIFGLVEASAGFWVSGYMEGGFWVSGNMEGRRAAGMTILWLGLLPIVLVAAIGSFAILNMK